jgi:hypothetical protein
MHFEIYKKKSINIAIPLPCRQAGRQASNQAHSLINKEKKKKSQLHKKKVMYLLQCY